MGNNRWYFMMWFPVVVVAVSALSAEPSLKKQDGQFATFETPSTMTRPTNAFSVDTFQDSYVSTGISLSFDCETAVIPRKSELQKQIEQAVEAWSKQRKQDWAKDFYVNDSNGRTIASVHPMYTPKEYPERPYYLYLGFAVGDGNFSIHVRFRTLDSLNDIERILKSIKVKTR